MSFGLWSDFVTLISKSSSTQQAKVTIRQLSNALSQKNYSYLISDDEFLTTNINGTIFFAYMTDVQSNNIQLVIEPQWSYKGKQSGNKNYALPFTALEQVELMEEFSRLRLDEIWTDFAVEVEQCRKVNNIQIASFESFLKKIDLYGIEYNFKAEYPNVIYLQFGESTNKKVFYKASVSMDNFQEIISLLREFITDTKLRRKYGVKKERCGEYRFLR